jgi:hypothetical protein
MKAYLLYELKLYSYFCEGKFQVSPGLEPATYGNTS